MLIGYLHTSSSTVQNNTDRGNPEATKLQSRQTQPGCLSASHWHLVVVDSLKHTNITAAVKMPSLLCLSALNDSGYMTI